MPPHALRAYAAVYVISSRRRVAYIMPAHAVVSRRLIRPMPRAAGRHDDDVVDYFMFA